jgi:uncharacterized protein
MDIPRFKYHPDPIITGSIIESDKKCRCCRKARGYIYVGPVYYAIKKYNKCICPWCIADGSAHEKLDASFTDAEGVGIYGNWDEVPLEMIEEVTNRTPGFSGWQREQWWAHCQEPGQFLGRAGCEELKTYGPEVIKAIQDSTGLGDGEWGQLFPAFDKNGSPTAYLFRCPNCGKIGGYGDWDEALGG